jgi:hypothetical protein
MEKCILVYMWSTRYSCKILMKLDFFFENFSKNTQMSYYIKIRPVGAEMFRADGRTYGPTRLDDSSSLFSQFCESA